MVLRRGQGLWPVCLAFVRREGRLRSSLLLASSHLCICTGVAPSCPVVQACARVGQGEGGQKGGSTRGLSRVYGWWRVVYCPAMLPWCLSLCPVSGRPRVTAGGIYICMYTYVYIYLRICMYVYLYIWHKVTRPPHTRELWAGAWWRPWTYIYIYMCVSLYIYIYIYMYVCMHTYGISRDAPPPPLATYGPELGGDPGNPPNLGPEPQKRRVELI